MSGAVAFNLVVATLPLFVFALGVAGFVLQARFPDPGAQAVLTVERLLPPGAVDAELLDAIGRIVNGAVARRTGLSLVGSVLLLFFSTRLAATLRSVLRVVFEVPDRRPLVRAKLHDVQIVLVGGLLVLVDLAVTAFGTGLGPLDQLLGLPLTLFIMWILFALVFRYVPARATPWPTVLVGATTAAAAFAAMRIGFGWYVTRFATFASGFGSLATFVVLYLFLYYTAVLFVLSGEVAFLWTHPEGRASAQRTLSEKPGVVPDHDSNSAPQPALQGRNEP